MISECITVCDQYNIPTPDVVAGLRFKGVNRTGGRGDGKLDLVEDMLAESYIWQNDSLVYECELPQYGINGGVDTLLNMYTCQVHS